MEVEVDVLGSPSLIVCTVCVDVTTLNLSCQSVRRIAELVPTPSLSGRVETSRCGPCYPQPQLRLSRLSTDSAAQSLAGQ